MLNKIRKQYVENTENTKKITLLILIMIIVIFTFISLNLRINKIKTAINYKTKKLNEYKQYSEQIKVIRKEYNNLLIDRNEIIRQLHSSIKLNNIELKSLSHERTGKNLIINIKIFTSFKVFNKFCSELITNLAYRPRVVSLSIVGREKSKLKIQMKLNYLI